jgi:hypothetical protein
MAIARDDRWLADALGRALAGAEVYYCTQPATTTTNPPSPLATVYSDLSGTPLTQPIITDGFGHSIAYLQASSLYTLVFIHPLFGTNPVVLTDQAITAIEAGPTPVTPTPDPDGLLRAFTLPFTPLYPANGQLFVAGSYVQYGVAYTISGANITWIGAVPPQIGDKLVYFGT